MRLSHPQRHISQNPIAKKHQSQSTQIQVQVAKANALDGREIHNLAKSNATLISLIVWVLNFHKQFVAVVAEWQVLKPGDEGRDLLNVVPADEEEREHGDRGQCCGLFHVHEDCPQGQSYALGDKHIEEYDWEG